MESRILKSSSVVERKTILRDTADKKEVFTYPKVLTDGEVIHLKDEYTKNAIKMAKQDEAKKEFMETWKASTKPLRLEMGVQMTRIRNKVEEVTEEVYLISDQESNEMGYYNERGELVYSRPLMPDERQLSLVSKQNLTGTEN